LNTLKREFLFGLGKFLYREMRREHHGYDGGKSTCPSCSPGDESDGDLLPLFGVITVFGN